MNSDRPTIRPNTPAGRLVAASPGAAPPAGATEAPVLDCTPSHRRFATPLESSGPAGAQAPHPVPDATAERSSGPCGPGPILRGMVDLEPLVTARQLLRLDIGHDAIVDQLRRQYSLETSEADAAIAAARA